MKDRDCGFFERAFALGFQAGVADNALYRFGVDYCEKCLHGIAGPEDAEEAWISFDKGRSLGREQRWSGTPSSLKVQVSKLRQFAEVGVRVGAPGLSLLGKLPLLIEDPARHNGVYTIAVDVCRRMLKAQRALKDAEVKELYP